MAPDLNSLPPSRSVPASPGMTRTLSQASSDIAGLRRQTPSPSSRRASVSLQAAASVNAGLQQEDSRRSPRSSGNGTGTRTRQLSHGRRRSAVLMNLQLNDPSLPAPGEMITEAHRTSSPLSLSGSPIQPTGDPHHNRTASLGEIHQELEQEQEAQVNRLLQMIRAQQQQLQQLQAASGQPQTAAASAALEESATPSERSSSISNPPAAPLPTSTPRSPVAFHPRSSFDMTRADIQRRSRTPSRTASPRLRSTSISGEGGEPFSLSGRDENAFYQAETQMLARENQMLRQRIRELERQVNELNTNAPTNPHEPATSSHLLSSTSVSDTAADVPPPSSSALTTSESAVEEPKDETAISPAPV